MTVRVGIIALAVLCFLGLGLVLQPVSHRAPRIEHTYRLDNPDRNLPTLGPGRG